MQMAVQALEAFSICSGVNSGLLLNGSTWTRQQMPTPMMAQVGPESVQETQRRRRR